MAFFKLNLSIAFAIECIADVPIVGWWRGVVVNAFRLKRSYSTPGPVSTVMGDCLRAGKPSWCEACQLGRFSLYPPWDGKMSSNSFAWVTEGGDLGTANWGCQAGCCASLRLQAAHWPYGRRLWLVMKAH